MKTFTMATAFIFLTVLEINAQSALGKSEADIYWESMPVLFGSNGPQRPKPNSDRASIEYKEAIIKSSIYTEMFSRVFRDWGIEFWKRFPDDLRRFKWLKHTCIYEPAYFANPREGAIARSENRYIIALDTTAKKEWKVLFRRYLSEFLTSNENRESFYSTYFLLGISQEKWRNSESDKFDFIEFVRKAVNYAELVGPKFVDRNLSDLVRDQKEFGLADDDIKQYIHLLKLTKFPEFHRKASGMESIMKLKEIPLKLSAKSTEGKHIDLKQYRGKLVLVDFWNLGCSVCISKMPEIKAVYEAYKNQGFEVISVCLLYQLANERKTIENIYHKVGADWPLLLMPGKEGQGRVIFDTYGWQGVPQLLLLDEGGKLIHYGGDMLNAVGGLERLVKKHFENKSIKTQGGK
jgi:thiol-disulfide isomerase/thioredoxin